MCKGTDELPNISRRYGVLMKYLISAVDNGYKLMKYLISAVDMGY